MGVAAALAVALGLLGLAVGRWWLLAAPFLVVPAFYLGLDRGWWLDGLGDGWQYALALVLALCVAATGAGIALGAAARARRT